MTKKLCFFFVVVVGFVFVFLQYIGKCYHVTSGVCVYIFQISHVCSHKNLSNSVFNKVMRHTQFYKNQKMRLESVNLFGIGFLFFRII